MTPRVTYEGEVILDLTVESSNLGASISVAGQDVPSFGSRKVKTRLRLREGESNLLAGLLRDDQRKALTGFPGVMHVPVLRSLFGSTSDTINQTDIVMLLTPHIVRTHELTAEDLAPIYIGTQQNVGLERSAAADRAGAERGTCAACASRRRADQTDSRRAAARTRATAGRSGARRAADQRARAAGYVRGAEFPAAATAAGRQSCGSGAGRTARGHAAAGDRRAAGRGSGNHGGAVTGRSQYAGGAADWPAARRDAASAERAARFAGRPATQVIVTAPPEMRVASGPSTVPLSVNNASRLSAMTLTVTFNPNVLRVRTVQEGTFMRQGGVTASFTPRIDAVAGRVDIAITRSGDQAGASGTGLLAALLFDAVGHGQLDDPGQRRRQHAGRVAGRAAVHAGVGDGAIDAVTDARRGC